MISESDHRLGRNGVDEIKEHPFFEGFDWGSVRKITAPYVPSVCSEVSAENFDKFEEEEPFLGVGDNKNKKIPSRKFDMHFIGYTYKADVESERSMLVNVLKDLDTVSESQVASVNHNNAAIQNQKL